MKSWFLSRKLFMRILALTLGALMILCTFFAVYLYINARNSNKDAIFYSEYERSANLLNQSDIYINQLISISSSFSTLAIPGEELSISGNYWTRTTLNKMLESHMAANKHIENIDIVIGKNSLSPTQTQQERLLGRFSFFDIYSANEASWPYNFDLVSTYGNRFNKVTISISAHYLSRQVFTYNSKERQDYLLTADGIILLTNRQTCLFEQVNDVLPGIQLSPSTNLRSHGDYYYVLSEADKFGFQILSLVPKVQYSAQFSVILLQTILMAAFLFLFALLISLFLAMRFYRPIKKTVELLQAYIPDNLHDYENEIAFIHQNMTKYLEKEKCPDTAQPFSRIQEAQIAVLQHQINSHFLYNTLESIKAISVSELGIDNEVENSIFLLGSIIQEGVFQKKMIVPLSHEIFLSRCYLELMQIRFPDVEVVWSVDESLNSCQVLKFMLQPILENCFSHAFTAGVLPSKKIEVIVEKENQDLLFCICDNGVGIDDTFIAGVESFLNAPEDEAEYSHVGIRNVHKRIVDIFGQSYGLRIRKTEPGTVVEIRIPRL